MNRPLLLVTAVALSASAFVAFVSACTGNGSSSPSEPGGPDKTKDGEADTSVTDIDSSTGVDGSTTLSTCALTRVYETECNKVRPDGGIELTCGDKKFDSWCELNDKAINSAAYRRAEERCLTTMNCAYTDRRDCEYKSYNTAIATAAQKSVVAAYCATCEPTNQSACVISKTNYDATKGPKGTDDVFVAAWELNDTLTDMIRTQCTGAKLDASAGPDAAACLKQFGNCAGGIYVDALPDCPK